jgi:hypothetical protein
MALKHLALAVAVAIGSWACDTRMGSPASPTPTMDPAPPPSVPPPPPAPATARYEVTFESTWSASTHPVDFPADAHYSGLIGGTHNASVSFWREGELATEGIRAMAERGAKSTLADEVSRAITDGRAAAVLSGGAIDRSPGSVTLEFEVSQAHPLVTVVTMVAPSPDWFAGVTGLPLFVNGAWLTEATADMIVFDAGTDSGPTFRSPDEETRPRQLIHRLIGYPIGNGAGAAPFGRIVFRLK